MEKAPDFRDEASRRPHCECITCSDQALPALVLQLLPDGMALVECDGALEEVSLELCEAAAGDVVFVHAKVAIAKLDGKT